MRSIAVPADMDAQMHDPNVNLSEWLDAQPDGPLRTVRRFQVALKERDIPTIHEMLPTLPDVAPAAGLRLMALGTLEAWEEVMRQPPQPSMATDALELEMEGLVHAWTAYGVASCQTGNFDQAVLANQMGVAFASVIGMKQRAQMLGLELERTLTVVGRPDPDSIQAKLMHSMPQMRRQWGQRNLAESHMALGCYATALRSLGLPDQDGPEDAALREYLHAVLRLPRARAEEDPLLTPALAYTRLARAGRMIPMQGRDLGLDGITGEPQATYALMLKASALYKTPGMVQEAADMLQSVKTMRPDSLFYKYIFLLSCHISGAAVRDPHLLIDYINSASASLRAGCDLMESMAVFAPEAFAFLTLAGPGVGINPVLCRLDLLKMPQLAGSEVRYLSEVRGVPSRAGRNEVLEAMHIPQPPLFPQEHKRMREATADLPMRRVNLGWVAFGCIQMYRAARRAGLPTQAVAWKDAYARVFKKLTADVAIALKALPEYDPETLR